MSRGTSRADDGFVSILTLYHRSGPERSVSVGRGNSPGSYGNGTANVKPKSIRCTATAYCARGRVRRAFRARSRGRARTGEGDAIVAGGEWVAAYVLMYVCTMALSRARCVPGRCSWSMLSRWHPWAPPHSRPQLMMRAGFGISSHD